MITKDPISISYYEVTVAGELSQFNDKQIYDCGFVWSDVPTPTTQCNNKKYFGPISTPQQLEHKITNLEPGKTYYYKVFAITSEGIKYGNEKNFTTSSFPWKPTTEFGGLARLCPVSFSIENKGYVCLGANATTKFKDLWEFDPANKTWTKKADFPGTERSAATSFTIGKKGYIITGQCEKSDCWEYDPSTDKWSQIADFPISNYYYAASFSIGNKGYVGTGVSNNGMVKNLWEYNPSTNKWTEMANFPGTPMDVAVGFSIGGKGYFATGNLPIGDSNEVWEYDPNSNSWNRKADFPYKTMFAVGFSIKDKGYVGLGFGDENRFFSYDPTSDTWTKIVDFSGSARYGETAFVINNTAFVGLGYTSDYSKDFWEFNP